MFQSDTYELIKRVYLKAHADIPFFFNCSGDHRDLHSFPTRRSSDLDLHPALPRAGRRDDPGRGAGRRDPQSAALQAAAEQDRKSTRLNSSHVRISYAVFCLKKKKNNFLSINLIDILMNKVTNNKLVT